MSRRLPLPTLGALSAAAMQGVEEFLIRSHGSVAAHCRRLLASGGLYESDRARVQHLLAEAEAALGIPAPADDRRAA
jgi:hypothetical protein